MATFSKLPSGKWRAQVERKGVRKSASFPTKQAAKDWAARQEYLILNAGPPGSAVTFAEVMDRYAREVSPKRRGARWEMIRLEKFQTHDIADKKMADLAPADFAAWRDARLREVAPGSVAREMNLLSAVLSVARKEWGLIDRNPMADVRKPPKPPPRDRLVTPREMEALAIATGDDLTNATARAFHAFAFACETAMRAGEIVGLTWDRVYLDQRYVHLPMTKNGTARDVPLSSKAVEMLEALPRLDPVFGLTSSQLDTLWRKVRGKAGVEGLTFHDSRHRAISDLARKVDVLDLARIVGHRDIKMLMTYYNASAEDIAKRLG